MSLARRSRPVPLTATEEEEELARASGISEGNSFEVVVKNTFIQVSAGTQHGCEHGTGDYALTAGLRTAPASLHRAGAMQLSLTAAGRTPRSRAVEPSLGGDVGTESPVTSTTAASTPPTPAQVCLWPPTPASPRERVPLSLVDLTDFSEPPVAGLPPTNLGFQQGSGMPPPHEAQGPMGYSEFYAMPPPPMESPKFPPGILLPVACPALHSGPPANAAEFGRSPVVACVANAPVPRFAPPTSPAPEPLAHEESAAFHVPPLSAPSVC